MGLAHWRSSYHLRISMALKIRADCLGCSQEAAGGCEEEEEKEEEGFISAAQWWNGLQVIAFICALRKCREGLK